MTTSSDESDAEAAPAPGICDAPGARAAREARSAAGAAAFMTCDDPPSDWRVRRGGAPAARRGGPPRRRSDGVVSSPARPCILHDVPFVAKISCGSFAERPSSRARTLCGCPEVLRLDVCGADMAAEQQRFDIVLPITFPAALDVRGLSGLQGASEDPGREMQSYLDAGGDPNARVRIPRNEHTPTLPGPRLL